MVINELKQVIRRKITNAITQHAKLKNTSRVVINIYIKINIFIPHQQLFQICMQQTSSLSLSLSFPLSLSLSLSLFHIHTTQ